MYPKRKEGTSRPSHMEELGAASFYLDCHPFPYCRHVVVPRDAWGDYRCPTRPENHAFVPIIQERSESQLKATNPKEYGQEGRKFGTRLSKVFTLQPAVKFEHISNLAQCFAIDVINYCDAGFSNSVLSAG